MVEKINLKSEDILEENISKLRQIFPNVFSEGTIDFDILKETLGNFSNSSNEKYSFSWAGRAESIKNIQTPTHGTLIPEKDESINFDDTENIFIEGENLEVLKLLQKTYSNKIKIIYIDPPYNTGNDFIYQDDFSNSLDNYLQQTGQKKEGIKLTSNPETSGRFHSDWISFMYPRLFLARELLKDDGVIFVSIDDSEANNLKNIMNEIFGEENFVANFVWKRRSGANDPQNFVSIDHEYLVCYRKSKRMILKGMKKDYSKYKNPDNDPRGPWMPDNLTVGKTKDERPNLFYEIIDPETNKIYKSKTSRVWVFEKKRMLEEIKNKRIIFPKKNGGMPQYKRFQFNNKSTHKPLSTWIETSVKSNKEVQEIKDEYNLEIMQTPLNAEGTKELRKILQNQLFNYPKPSHLIKEILSYTSNENDIILDFFAGSGTTGQAVLELNEMDEGNRKFICVQLPEVIDYGSNIAKSKFNTISDISKERIRQVIKNIEKENKQQKLNAKQNQDLGFKVFKLAKSNYKVWQDIQDEAKLKDQLKLFEDPLVENYKDIDVIYEIIIKEGYSLNSEITEMSTKPNKIYKVSDGEFLFYVTLDKKIDEKAIQSLDLTENTMFVCLDSALDDSDKINLEKQCKLRVI